MKHEQQIQLINQNRSGVIKNKIQINKYTSESPIYKLENIVTKKRVTSLEYGSSIDAIEI